jgi:hypothetical protein
MIKLFFSFLIVFFSFVGMAQTSISADDPKFKLLLDKKAEYHRKTDGEYDGYRLKIHFGSDRSKAMEVKSRFLGKYSDFGAYDEYQQPNFVIVVGDFKTKPDAYGFLKQIQGDFPNAFIIKDKIKPGKG